MLDPEEAFIYIVFRKYLSILTINLMVSFAFYFGVGGFIHYHYYVKQRSHPETWKCQPKKWLPPELERHEILLGSTALVLGSIMYSAVSTYISFGGVTCLYFTISDYGWTWFFLSIPLHFLYQEAGSYYIHVALHTKTLYIPFHKLHHTYKQPTAYSATAFHPVELIMIQSIQMAPIFFFPIHIGIYFSFLIYAFYYGIMVHSGVMIKPLWPWQLDPIFHDNHHQYTHVNFGFNVDIFDRINKTMRVKDRVYDEHIYGGKGKALTEATVEEMKFHEEEQENEIQMN
jgi:lathosterol oxidase